MSVDPAEHPASSSGLPPQIRSRITVVCAECKRLKLKCDRRAPCGSCTKRDTVARCIYSPAAAEKVDLHSLNNRLIQVEAQLAQLQSRQSSHDPLFQSGASSCPSTASTTHQHHHHTRASVPSPPIHDSIFLTVHDTALQFLEDLELAGPSSSTAPESSSSRHVSVNFVKVEPSNVDLQNAQSDCSHVVDADERPSRLKQIIEPPAAPVISVRHRMLCSVQFLLPQLSIYYPISPGGPSPTPAPSFPMPSSLSYEQKDYASVDRPLVTLELLELLPNINTFTRLLHYANNEFKMRPVPLAGGWRAFETQCFRLVGASEKREENRGMEFDAHENSDRNLGLNHEQTHGASSVRQEPSMASGSGTPSLAFFGVVCATLALGAYNSPGDGRESSEFFYALGQQALGAWDSHVGSTSLRSTETNNSMQDEVEEEKLDYLLASIINLVYLQTSGEKSETEKAHTMGLIFPLVGRMVNVARGMGLGRDSDRGVLDEECEDRKRMIWWDIVFYDLFSSDVLGHPPLIPSNSYTVSLPMCSMHQNEMDENESGEEGDDAGQRKVKSYRKGGSPADDDPMAERDTMTYFGERCRLAQLTQHIKYRLAHPDCCCGYTLDQAAALEALVQQCLANLPTTLKQSRTPFNKDTDNPTLYAQSCELIFMAGMLIIRIYAPFLRSTNSHPSVIPSTPTPLCESAVNPAAYHAIICAAQCITRALPALQKSLSSDGPPVTPPMLTDFFPLGDVLFDSLVACAHGVLIGLGDPSPSVPQEEIRIALATFDVIYPGSDWRRKVLLSLQQRLSSRSPNLLKRKHDTIVASEPPMLPEHRSHLMNVLKNYPLPSPTRSRPKSPLPEQPHVSLSLPQAFQKHRQRQKQQEQQQDHRHPSQGPQAPPGSQQAHAYPDAGPSLRASLSRSPSLSSIERHKLKLPVIGIRKRLDKEMGRSAAYDTSPPGASGQNVRRAQDLTPSPTSLVTLQPRSSLDHEAYVQTRRLTAPLPQQQSPQRPAAPRHTPSLEATSSSGYSSRSSPAAHDIRLQGVPGIDFSVGFASTEEQVGISRERFAQDPDQQQLFRPSPIYDHVPHPRHTMDVMRAHFDEPHTQYEQPHQAFLNSAASYEHPVRPSFHHTRPSLERPVPTTEHPPQHAHFDYTRPSFEQQPLSFEQRRNPYDHIRGPPPSGNASTKPSYGTSPFLERTSASISSGSQFATAGLPVTPLYSSQPSPPLYGPDLNHGQMRGAMLAPESDAMGQQQQAPGVFPPYDGGYNTLSMTMDAMSVDPVASDVGTMRVFEKSGGGMSYEKEPGTGMEDVRELQLGTNDNGPQQSLIYPEAWSSRINNRREG